MTDSMHELIDLCGELWFLQTLLARDNGNQR
jgi:hypothetical protein